MSTRSAVGIYTNKENNLWVGRYVHFDGYPEGVGATLFSEYQRVFRIVGENGCSEKQGVQNLIDFLMSEQVGWRALADKRFDLEPRAPYDMFVLGQKAYNALKETDEHLKPESFSRAGEKPMNSETGDLISPEETFGIVWAYIFDVDTMTMNIHHVSANWHLVESVDLNSELTPNWKEITEKAYN